MEFTFKIWASIKEFWPLYKKHFWSLFLMMIITMVVQFVGDKDNFPLMLVSFIVSLLISYIWIRFILNLIDKKDSNLFSKDVLPSLDQFWNFFKTLILYTLCVIGGFILFIVPGLYISGRLAFAIYLSVEKNQGGIATIKEAWKMTEGYGWIIFWKNFLIGLFIVVGFLVFFVGSFVTYPLGIMVMILMYREFYKFKMQNKEVPPTPEVVPELPKEITPEEIKQ